MPVLALEHALHRPAQADSQQTPSTQSPLAHWFPAVHEAPLACGEMQRPADEQKWPVVQSVLETQEVRHDAAPQT
jgi:hypothetical protein